MGLIPRQSSIPPPEPAPLLAAMTCDEILKDYYLEEFNVNLLQQQECELTIASPEIQQEIIEPSTDFYPVGFAILPSKKLPTESLTTIQPTLNISSLPGPHTPAYTQPMKHLKPAHTDVCSSRSYYSSEKRKCI